MGRCKVKPYDGAEPFVFVSYCHKDSKVVFPIIEELSLNGYRIWYDEGINPGTEWPEVIAEHLNAADACIAFVSNSSVVSHNCKQEINYALLHNKKFISVIIENTEMTPGMEMQLSINQSILLYELTSLEFYDKLYSADVLCNSVGEKSIKSNVIENERQIINKRFCLCYDKTGERIALPIGNFVIGRSETKADYRIMNNSTVGREHARIVNKGEKCVLIDNNSLNKTHINGIELMPDREYELIDNDFIAISNEIFSFHVYE